MGASGPTTSVTTPKVSGLNSPVRGQSLAERGALSLLKPLGGKRVEKGVPANITTEDRVRTRASDSTSFQTRHTSDTRKGDLMMS